jgi:hypothetical protein
MVMKLRKKKTTHNNTRPLSAGYQPQFIVGMFVPSPCGQELEEVEVEGEGGSSKEI